jgi:hypothetical protein
MQTTSVGADSTLEFTDEHLPCSGEASTIENKSEGTDGGKLATADEVEKIESKGSEGMEGTDGKRKIESKGSSEGTDGGELAETKMIESKGKASTDGKRKIESKDSSVGTASKDGEIEMDDEDNAPLLSLVKDCWGSRFPSDRCEDR